MNNHLQFRGLFEGKLWYSFRQVWKDKENFKYLSRSSVEEGARCFFNGLGEKIDKNTIQRFVGLCDKNGRNIFEGDILKLNFGEAAGSIGEVIYRGISFMVVSKHGAAFMDSYYNMTHGEVIGNIFENPKLLSK